MARRRVSWTVPARQELRDLRNFIRRDSPENAREYIQKLLDLVASLADFPERCRIVPELGEPYRESIHGNYRIVFRLEPEHLVVHGVIHSSRDFLQAFRSRPKS